MQNFRVERTWQNMAGFLFKSCGTIRLKHTCVCTHAHARAHTHTQTEKEEEKNPDFWLQRADCTQVSITPPPKHIEMTKGI